MLFSLSLCIGSETFILRPKDSLHGLCGFSSISSLPNLLSSWYRLFPQLRHQSCSYGFRQRVVDVSERIHGEPEIVECLLEICLSLH